MNLLRTDSRKAKLEEKVIQIVEQVLGEDHDPKQRRLELNSLKMLELIVALEDEFGIHISEDAPLARITSSVNSIVKYLRSALPEGSVDPTRAT